MAKEEEIYILLKDYPYLRCNVVYERDVNYIKKVLKLPYWKDPRYERLLTTNIWYSSYPNIINIMNLPYWEDPKFKKILSSNVWKRNYKEVEKVLEMEEWNRPEYSKLLTSNIWKSSYEDIKAILSMEILKDPRYSHLLVPSIFNVKIENIIPTIELLDSYGISDYVTNRCLRRNVNLTRSLIEYMINNGIPLLVIDGNNYKLNRLLSDSNSYLKDEHEIDVINLDGELRRVRTK